METTRYFTEQVLRKRPYLRNDWIEATLVEPLARENPARRPRIRWWRRIELAESDKSYILRVVTLDDGETVHNAFFDRSYREEE